MRIIVDVMGGDKAPSEIIKGAVDGGKNYAVDITLVGNKPEIEKSAADAGISLDGIEIAHSDEKITMEDDPLYVVRAKKNSSMNIGLTMLRDYEGGAAFVSAGNTGALLVGSSHIIRTVKGIHRASIATILPFQRPLLLLDSGANINVEPQYLLEWAVIGTIYMERVMGVKSPEVRLLNNGSEEHKGTAVEVEAYKMLSDCGSIHFGGNAEGSDVPSNVCDVLVTDGFTGNILLKYTEGMGKFFFRTMKGMFTANLPSKLAYLAVKGSVGGIRKAFDASEYGGSPLLGLKKPVIKAHGSSDARAIENAVRQAKAYLEHGVTAEIEAVAEKIAVTLEK